jgi:hypothetical protein
MKNGMSKIMVSNFFFYFTFLLYQVAVRLRPMWKKESERGELSIVKILDRNVVILMDPADVL